MFNADAPGAPMTTVPLGRAEQPADRQIDLAYKLLRREIMSCRLEPGSEITEADLALEYGFGKAAIRAALMGLSQEKLVIALPRRGYQITGLTLQDVHEIFQLRAMLEPAAVELATAHVDAKRLRQLDAACARGYAAADATSKARFLQANREFHATIIRACGNRRLTDLLENVIDQLQRLFHIGLEFSLRRAELRQQHLDLLNAIVEQDAAAARQAAARHIETMRCAVIDSIMRSQSLREASVFPRNGTIELPRRHARRGRVKDR